MEAPRLRIGDALGVNVLVPGTASGTDVSG